MTPLQIKLARVKKGWTQEQLAKKKHNKSGGNHKIPGTGHEKIKVEGLRRKKRRMKLKAKGDNDAIIEKFSA